MSHTIHDTDGPCRQCLRDLCVSKGLTQTEGAKDAGVSTGGFSQYLNRKQLHPGNHDKLYKWLAQSTQLAPTTSLPEPVHRRSVSLDHKQTIRRAMSEVDSESIGVPTTSNESESDIFRSGTPDCIESKNEVGFLKLYIKYMDDINALKHPINAKDIKEYGFVYVLTDNEKRVKIGISRDMPGRANNLFSGNPDLRVAGFYASWFYLHAETCLHNMLHKHRYENQRVKNKESSTTALSGAQEFFSVPPEEALFLVAAVVLTLESRFQQEVQATK